MLNDQKARARIGCINQSLRVDEHSLSHRGIYWNAYGRKGI